MVVSLSSALRLLLALVLFPSSAIAWISSSSSSTLPKAALVTSKTLRRSLLKQQHNKEDYNSYSTTFTKDNTTTTTKKMKVLGICGGVGSGKSTACKLLVNDLGCAAHIDSDSMAHTVYRPGSQAVQDIVQEFGSDILIPQTPTTTTTTDNNDGGGGGDEMMIDRKKLGSIVFSNRAAMEKLERIVWPHTKDAILQEIERIRSEQFDNNNNNNNASNDISDSDEKPPPPSPVPPIVIVEAAVLLDAGWQDDFLDGVWVITASPSVALQRVVETRGWTQQEADQRIEAQMSRRGIGSSLEEEVANGTVTAVIDNSADLEDLKQSLSHKLKDPTAWYQ